jgi:hypothetical protein
MLPCSAAITRCCSHISGSFDIRYIANVCCVVVTKHDFFTPSGESSEHSVSQCALRSESSWSASKLLDCSSRRKLSTVLARPSLGQYTRASMNTNLCDSWIIRDTCCLSCSVAVGSALGLSVFRIVRLKFRRDPCSCARAVRRAHQRPRVSAMKNPSKKVIRVASSPTWATMKFISTSSGL